ncbi:unnamed protein product [Rhizophagus irregularis]|nr:unnamed protein product [Rhizophagus irregularis]
MIDLKTSLNIQASDKRKTSRTSDIGANPQEEHNKQPFPDKRIHRLSKIKDGLRRCKDHLYYWFTKGTPASWKSRKYMQHRNSKKMAA